MSEIPQETLLAQLQWRYACKLFQKDKKIPTGTWSSLEQALVLSPSSYGLQPWRFLVITDQDIRARLKKASYDQKQVDTCSHYVVFARKKTMKVEDIERYMARISEVRGTELSKLDGFKKLLVEDVVNGDRGKNLKDWATRQLYIALGNFMTSAALLGVDTCPMEGIKIAEYDKILGLEDTDFASVVACAAGYRDSADAYIKNKKVRYPVDDVIQRI